MLPEQRRRRIVELLDAQEAADVASLAGEFGVSPATIRRDLHQLEKGGLLTRTHGGAVAPESTAFEPLHADKTKERWAEKVSIARHAAKWVSDGDVVVLDSGSTTLALARQLKQLRQLTLITTDLKIALEVADAPGFNVICVGGLVRPGLYSVVGSIAGQALAQFHANHAFIGADAVNLRTGVSNASMQEVDVKQSVIRAASHVVLLADHSKFERSSLVKVCDLSAFDEIVTDAGIDPHTVSTYADRNVSIQIAPRESRAS